MRRLLILRHAKAEPLLRGGDDHARALAARGRNDAMQIGNYLAQQNLIPDYVVLSSARRVQETWQHLVPALPHAPAPHTERRLYDASRDAIIAVVRALPDTALCAMIVGHNPGLHEAALALARDGDETALAHLSGGLPTSGLIVIDCDKEWHAIVPGGGRLERFIVPRALAFEDD